MVAAKKVGSTVGSNTHVHTPGQNFAYVKLISEQSKNNYIAQSLDLKLPADIATVETDSILPCGYNSLTLRRMKDSQNIR